MTTDRRAPTPALGTKGRRPPRAPRQVNGLDHSHIRVIPHRSESDELENEYDHGVPTFRSPSLQFASAIASQTRANEDPTVEPSQVKTFADMARRHHHMSDELGSEQSTLSPGALGGIVTLQTHRKSWRPIRGSDLSQCENVGDNASESPLGYRTSEYSPRDAIYSHAGTTMTSRPSLQYQIQSMLDNSSPAAFRAPAMPLQTSDGENHRPQTYDPPSHSYGKLFGKLPDPIRLHEETGEFDGQVVFIGHPNRDVSAHQWSSTSYQWINIGRYAHVRGKVEGSLASDCLGRHDASQHPVEFFKCAAENRERLAMERARRNATTQPPFSVVPYSEMRASSLEIVNDPSTPESLQGSIVMEDLEDPFVARASSQLPGEALLDHSRAGKAKINGSLDFKYEFPFKTGASAQFERPKTDYRGVNLPDRVLQPLLHEVSFGEDAATYAGSIAKYSLPRQQSSTYASLHSKESHRVPGNNSTKPELPISYARMTTEGRTMKSHTPNAYATARSLFPASGLTVANPRRAVLDEVDTGLSRPELPANIPESEASGSQATTINPVTVALRFSDPDGLRQSQDYEIANGLSKQAPTVQNLKGPFFTDTKPTTSDPTAPLSMRIREEEKLSNWFHDGHRSARQQAYATSLMSTAVSFEKSRHLGAIGETVNSRPCAKYENTPAFVRLYENLSEYVDERRNGNRGSYFTRAWKTHSQDVNSNEISGHLGKQNAGSMRIEGTGGYQAARYANRGRGGA